MRKSRLRMSIPDGVEPCHFIAPLLPPGDYTVSVEVTGFAPVCEAGRRIERRQLAGSAGRNVNMVNVLGSRYNPGCAK